MPYQANDVAQVTHKETTTSYFFSPKHRGNPTAEISVWSINFESELSCFSASFENQWHDKKNGWGCIVSQNSELAVLGYNSKNAELIIAKFVTNQNQWHGYPADIKHKPKDRPLPEIILKWFNEKLISKPLMLRIKQGQI